MKDRSVFTPMRYTKIIRGGSNININEDTPIWSQLLETILIVLIFSLVINFIDFNFQQLKKYQHMAVNLYPLSYNTAQVFIQDPESKFPILEPSKDERNGSEYSYSCFINISPDTFNICKGKLQHIFHKGSPTVFPLMAPGVFIKSDTNELRVYHNSTKTWNNYIDISNIPVNKWVHLVVMLKGTNLEVYVNGNMASRMKFTDVPKINYSDFYLLNDFVTSNTQNFLTAGSMKGYVSRVKYFAYALSSHQIDTLLKEGPNKIVYSKKNANMDTYANLTDDWYTSEDHNGIGPQ